MKKLVALLLAGLMIFAFAACSGKGGAETTEPEASSNADTTNTAEPTKKLIMATNAAFPPYEFKEGDDYAGIDVELARAIAKELGCELEIADVDFGAIVTGVQTGKYDFGMAGMTVTEDRLKNVNFSTSYAKGIQSIIVPEGSEYKSLDDFYVLDESGKATAVKEGVKIGVQQDTTGDIYSSDTVENAGFGEQNVTRYKTGADAVQALVSGKVSAVIIDNQPAKSYVAANEGLVILEGSYTDEDYAICVAKENEELLNNINDALAKLTADGTVDTIVKKYISD